MLYLYLAIFTLLAPLILWYGFLGVMNLLRVQQLNKLEQLPYRLGLPFVIASVVLDIYVNCTWGFIFLQLPHPKRLMLSARMDDIILNEPGCFKWLVRYRFNLALWIVGTLLEPFDTSGQHTTHGKLPI